MNSHARHVDIVEDRVFKTVESTGALLADLIQILILWLLQLNQETDRQTDIVVFRLNYENGVHIEEAPNRMPLIY
jgi:hypothetical protein